MLSFVSFDRSADRDGLRALLPAGLDSPLLSRLTTSLYSLSGGAALLPWFAVSLGESLLFPDSKHAILVRMYNRHRPSSPFAFRVVVVVPRSYVRLFIPSFSFVHSFRSFVRSFGSRSFACSVCYTTKACSPGHTTIRLLYTSYTATNTVVSPTSHDHQSSRIANTTAHRFSAQFRPARCTAEIISTAAFTEPDSACLMLELRFAEIGKFNDAAAATSAHPWHPGDFALSHLAANTHIAPAYSLLSTRVHTYVRAYVGQLNDQCFARVRNYSPPPSSRSPLAPPCL